MIASTMSLALRLPFPLHTKSKQGIFTKNLSSQGGIGGEINAVGSVTVLSAVEEAKLFSIASWIQKMRRMKKKEAKSWRNVALLLRHESRRFFQNNAVYCCQRRGKPLCNVMPRRFSGLSFSFFEFSLLCDPILIGRRFFVHSDLRETQVFYMYAL